MTIYIKSSNIELVQYPTSYAGIAYHTHQYVHLKQHNHKISHFRNPFQMNDDILYDNFPQNVYAQFSHGFAFLFFSYTFLKNSLPYKDFAK